MKITFYGAARTVTGSCYLVEHKGKTFLVDCGLFQGNKELKKRNYDDFLFNPGEIDFMVLTHAHIDHAGLIPKLYLAGFKGDIYATKGTSDLSSALLPDCGYIQTMEVERKNRKKERSDAELITPIYTAEDAEACLHLFQPLDYNQMFEPIEGVKMILKDAGHILGSSMLEIFYNDDDGTERHLVFTGDMGRPADFILDQPTTFTSVDFLVCESTYGNRLHEEIQLSTDQLAEIITRTFRRGGNVVIPAFAVDRTQDLLIMLHGMLENKDIPSADIYLDSPLAVRATEIFAENPQYYNEELLKKYVVEGGSPFKFPNLKISRTSVESQAINNIKSGAIIISASGMADAGRIKHHLKHNLWRQESSVIFMGYQAEGTLGRRLVDGEKLVRIHGEEVQVRAEIVQFDGFSAHADYQEILDWIGNFAKAPTEIFLTHGEEDACLTLAAKIAERFNYNTVVPNIGDVFDLKADTKLTPVKQGAPAPAKFDESIIPDIYYSLRVFLEKGNSDKIKDLQGYLHELNK